MNFQKIKKNWVFHSVLRWSRRCGLIQPPLLSSNIQKPHSIRVNYPFPSTIDSLNLRRTIVATPTHSLKYISKNFLIQDLLSRFLLKILLKYINVYNNFEGGSLFQWHPDHNISFAFVPSYLDWSDVYNVRAKAWLLKLSVNLYHSPNKSGKCRIL